MRTRGMAMSCGRKFSASVVNAAITNRNSSGRYTCMVGTALWSVRRKTFEEAHESTA